MTADLFSYYYTTTLFRQESCQLTNLMNQNAFWKYYRDFNFFNLSFSVLSGIFFGPVSALLIFLSFGMGIGYLGYNFFRKDEYYLYYNLGFSKSYLIKKVWLFNLLFMGPVLLILFLFL